MFVTNFEDLHIKLFGCNKQVADYLIYDAHIPIIGQKADMYYFAQTGDLQIALDKMPLLLRMINYLTRSIE